MLTSSVMKAPETASGIWELLRTAPKWRVPLVVVGGLLIALGFVAMFIDSIAAIFGVITGSRTANFGLLLDVVPGLVLPIWFYTQRWLFLGFGVLLLFWRSRKLGAVDDQDGGPAAT